MISKADIIAMARHVARRGTGHADYRIVHPSREWLIGLAGATILFLGAGAHAGFFFWSKGNALVETPLSLETATYNHATIYQVLEVYAARSATHKALRPLLGVSATTTTSTSSVAR